MNSDDIRVNDETLRSSLSLNAIGSEGMPTNCITPDTVNKKLYLNTKQKEKPFLENVISTSSCPSDSPSRKL